MCDKLEGMLLKCEKKVPELNDDDAFVTEESVRAIREWRAHILRAVNQDQARRDVLDNLTRSVSDHIYVTICYNLSVFFYT